MADLAPTAATTLEPPAEPAPIPTKARHALLKRLADVVCLPSSRVNSFERAMTADLLVEMIRAAAPADRTKLAMRLAHLSEIPNPLLRLLLSDEIAVAKPLLEDSAHLSDSDLLGCVHAAQMEHRVMIAHRRPLTEVVGDALVARGEAPVTEALLKNRDARMSQNAIELVTAASRGHPALIPLLLRRPELRPAQAYVIFWWADADCRRLILQRFAVSREVLQEVAADVFPIAAAEGWRDPMARKALQFIERRQRNRAAIEKSPYDSLDAAIAAGADGLTQELVAEISYLAGIKPMTGAKLLSDAGGEGLAVLCKATGLPKSNIRALWRGLRRPETDLAGEIAPGLERVLIVYDMMAVDRAQTVLRYWNWALSSAMTPALLRAIREGDEAAVDEFSTPEKTAMLALKGDFG